MGPRVKNSYQEKARMAPARWLHILSNGSKAADLIKSVNGVLLLSEEASIRSAGFLASCRSSNGFAPLALFSQALASSKLDDSARVRSAACECLAAAVRNPAIDVSDVKMAATAGGTSQRLWQRTSDYVSRCQCVDSDVYVSLLRSYVV